MRLFNNLAINFLIMLGFAVATLPPVMAVPAAQLQDNLCSSNDKFYDLSSWRKAPSHLIIDIRSPEDFRIANIPGSMNLPGFSLKHRGDLKQSNLLIVAEPYQFATTKHIASDLVRGGFPAPRILRLGILGAAAEGLEVLANRPLPRLIEISANTLATELAQENPRLIVPEESKFNSALLSQFGEVQRLTNKQTFRIASISTRPIVAVADSDANSRVWGEHVLKSVLAETPTATPTDETALPLQKQVVFFITGGTKAVEEYFTRHNEVITQVRRNKEPKSCR